MIVKCPILLTMGETDHFISEDQLKALLDSIKAPKTVRAKIGNLIFPSLISFAVGTLGLALVFFISLLNGSSTLTTIAHIKKY